MQVRDAMNPRTLTVGEDDRLGLAVQTMLWGGLRQVVVVREGRVVGVVSEQDVLEQQVERGAEEALELPVREVLSRDAVTADVSEELGPAVERMVAHRLGCLPVLKEGRLAGLLTPSDVLAAQLADAVRGETDVGPTARDLMTGRPFTTLPGDLLLDAAGRMSQVGVRHLPVVDSEGRVVGMLSDRDVRTAVGDPMRALEEAESRLRTRSLRVEAAMTPDPSSVVAEASLPELIAAFTDLRVGALPVVDEDERLLGIVSYVDVLGAMRL